MKKLSFLLLLITASAFGQAIRVDVPIQTYGPNVASAAGPLPQALWLSNATVQVCQHPASIGSCTPVITYNDYAEDAQCPTLTPLVQLPGTSCTASAGTAANVGFWYGGGPVDYIITSSYGTFGPYTISLGASGSNYLPLSGGHVTGAVTAPVINATQYVDGVTNTTVAQAMAALQAASPTGGDVWIPCGTFVGPPASAFFSGVHLRSSCHGIPQAWLTSMGAPNYGASPNLTILQYSTGLSLNLIGNIGLSNIVLDMTASGGPNFTMTAVSSSVFENLSVVNCSFAGGPCMTIAAGNASGTNAGLNHFSGRTFLGGGSWALDFTSGSNLAFATENVIDDLVISNPITGNILFDKYCDSNTLWRVSAFNFTGNPSIGIQFNGSATTDQGVQWEIIDNYDETGNGTTHSTAAEAAFIVNPSFYNYVRSKELAGGPYSLAVYNDPTLIPTSFTWMDQQSFLTATGPSFTIPNLYASIGMFTPYIRANNPGQASGADTLVVNEQDSSHGDGQTHFGLSVGASTPYVNYIRGSLTQIDSPVTMTNGLVVNSGGVNSTGYQVSGVNLASTNLSDSTSLARSGTGGGGINQAACILSAGPPPVLGHCTSVVSSSGGCTCAAN